ncbi:uncharacterized protein LOC132862417 isoform X2 [Tachysurus vachellii]|uniref:uncharacterized protein LOC132862417 isoform X2 n=1 Tax=Tachysurus vachellii TaxID=175792 RepID=UPI00296B1ACB|nr:uncharacterized protein LOC132862417 isoform X2 [Tachysurus vachellii]
MMKSLLIFTLSLISGPVACVMTGYTGGSVLIICDLIWGSGFSTYICKLGYISCTDIIRTNTTENSVQEGRFKLYENSNGFLRVLIRRLKPQDAGVYRIGVEDQTPIDVKLTVLNDSCCDGPKTVNVFPGQNISIISNYPVVYNRDYKFIMKLENGSVSNAFLDTFNVPQNNRFSISDDSIAKVLSMNISHVTEADDGVYLYGIFNRKNSIQYYSFFREIHLHVKEQKKSRSEVKLYSMMKILLIFTLSLISGPVGCVMTGYTGESIVIISDLKWGSGFSTYILLIRRLKPQDTGVYRIGVEDQTPTDLELTVLNDSCCDGPKTVNVFPGQNISIISNYPVIYNQDIKFIMKLENGSVFYAILDTLEKSQNNRFSIFDDSIAKVLGMNISNVTEADDGVYLYGIFNRKNSIQYYSFFREIHLHVKESSVNTTIIIIIIIISVCVLLIGGFTLLLIYKLRHKGTQGSRPSSQDNEHAPSVHENNLPNLPTYENLKIKIRSNEQNLGSSTNQSDSTYQTLDPLTNQSDSSYMSLSNTADQSHSHYQCLNARTQMNSVYQTLHS